MPPLALKVGVPICLLALLSARLLVPPPSAVPPLPLRGAPMDVPARLEPPSLRITQEQAAFDLTLGPFPDALPEGAEIEVVFPAQVVPLTPQLSAIYCSQAFVWFGQDVGGEGQRSVTLASDLPGADLSGTPAWRRWPMMGQYFLSRRGGDLTFSIKEGLCEVNRARVNLQEGLERGQEIRLSYKNFRLPMAPTRVGVAVSLRRGEDAPIQVLSPAPELAFVGGEAAALRVVTPATARPGEGSGAWVMAVDTRGHLDEGFEGEVEISHGEQTLGRARVGAQERGQVWVPLPPLPEGVLRLEARSGALRGQSPPLLVGGGEHGLSWGDIHRHSVMADGWASPEQVYDRGEHIEHLDFMSLSEHNHPDPMDRFGHYRRRVELDEGEWAYLKGLAERRQVPGRFVTLHGYEWSSDRGHRNVYFAPDEVMEPLLPFRTPSREELELTPSEFLRRYQGRRVLVIPHHSAFRALSGEAYDWGEAGAGLDRLAEIYSEHGSSEERGGPRPLHGVVMYAPDNPFIRLFTGPELLGPQDAAPPGQGNYLTEIMAAGRRMRFIASSDAHFLPDGPLSWPGGLVGVWSATLSREAVFDGLWARRVMATSGARMVLQLSAGGDAPEGVIWPWTDTLPLQEVLPVHVQVNAAAPLAEVTLVSHRAGRGYERLSWAPSSPTDPQLRARPGADPARDLTLSWALSGLAVGDFVYVRVVQQDSEVGWLGPFWVEG